MVSQPTEDHSDQANSEYSPWPRLTNIPRTWQPDPVFLRDLLSEIHKFDKLLNLNGLCNQASELLKNVNVCESTKSGADDLGDCEPCDSLGSNGCLNGIAELGNCDFILLEEWISRMNGVMERWINIRDKMADRAKSSRREMKERVLLLDDGARRRFLRKLPPGIDFSIMDSVHTSSSSSDNCRSESESESDGNFRPVSPSARHRAVEGVSPCLSDGIQLGVLLQSLPTEILHEVILKAQDSDPHIQFTLSQVNQFFRTLVTASPLLWSKLDLMCPLSVVSLYLQRSANATLDVVADEGLRIDPSPTLAAKNYTKCTAFYQMLRPHRHRIRCLKVGGPTSHSWERENQDAVQPREEPIGLLDHFLWSPMLSNLEYLELSFRAWEDRDHSQWPMVTKLQELRLYGPWMPSITFLVSPFLKHLTLGDHPRLAPKLVRNILLSTPVLESLTFSDVILVNPEEPDSNDAVTISSLKSLSVIRSPLDTIEHILKTIAYGNLHELCLNFTGREVPRPSDVYRVFYPVDVTALQLFSAPLPQLRKLDLVSCEANPSFLETTLDYLPGLKQLRIASAALTNQHLKVLVVNTLINGDVCEPIRCPQLSSLTIENEPLIGSNIVRYIARSRNEASFPLKSVTLRGVDREKVFWEDLQCIRDSGVVDLNVMVFGKDQAIECDDSESSSEWSTDQGSEDGLMSGDEDVIAS